VSKGTFYNIINKIMKAKLRKKCKVHQLNMAQIKKLRATSWNLYLKLKCNQWKNFVTSDEALFYLGGSYGRKKVCYTRKGDNLGEKL
jgi:hypothetical protein